MGDYQCKQDPTANHKKYAYRFWDIEENTFKLAEGPDWLTMDAGGSVLSGTPGASDVGATTVRVEAANQFGGRAEREFELTVSP